MTLATVPIQLPEALYRRLQSAAAVTHRSIDDILASAVSVALPPAPDLPDSLASELAEMLWLSDKALQAATKPTFTPKQQKRLAELNDLVDDRPLTPEEKAEQDKLLLAYERSVLRRAQAFAILARRGHRIPQYSQLAPKA
jgi:hypothetical protein